MSVRLLRSALCLVSLVAASVRAVVVTPTFTWSTGTPTSAFETAGNWTSEGGGAPTTGSALVFGATGGSSVAISSNFDADSLVLSGAFPAYVFSSANSSQLRLAAGGLNMGSGGATPVTFQSGLQIGLAASQTWNVGAGNLIVDAHVFEAGAGSRLTKTGAGTLTLSGTNAYSGGTTFNAGVISISADPNLGFTPATPTSGNLTFNGGALTTTASFTLNSNRGISLLAGGGMISPATSTTLSYGGVIDGTGPLIKSGGGTLTLSGNNTFTGGLSVNAGQISVSADANLGASTGALTLNSGVLISTATFPISATRTITLAGSGGGLSAAGGTVLAFSGVISGTGPLTIYNAGTVALSGVNTFTGGVVLNSGTLSIGQDSSLGTYPASPAAGNITFNGGTLVTSANLTLGANRGIAISAGGGAVSVESGTALRIDGVVAGTGPLLKSGSGLLELTGANTFSGALSVGAGGTLRASHASALGTTAGATSVTSGGALEIKGASIGAEAVTLNGTGLSGGGALRGLEAASLAGNITLASSASISAPTSDDALTLSGAIGESGGARMLTKTGTGAVILTGVASHTGGTVISAGRLQIGAGGTSGTISGNISNSGGELAFNRSDDLTYAGTMFGTGALLQLGGGLLTLTGNNGYSGGTTIASGGLSIGSGGTNGAISGNVANQGVLIFNRSDDLSFGGQISGSGSLIKRGGGVLTLNHNSSSFSGAVTIEAGVLAVSSIAAIDYSSSLGDGTSGTGTIAIGNGTTGATLRYTGSSGTYTDRPIDLAGTTGGATLDVTGSGSVDFAGNVTATGAGAKTLTLNSNSNWSINTLSGSISDNSPSNPTSLRKTGFGTWRLTGSANAYTGGTTINGGTLLLDASETLPTGGNVVINASSNNQAILHLNSTAQSIGALTFGGSGTNGMNAIVMGGSGDLTLAGNVSYSATNSPRESFIASGNLFNGSSSLYGGFLSLGGATRTFNIGNSSAADRELSIYAEINNGGVSKTGAGVLMLAGDSGYEGGTTVSAGTLLVGTNGWVDGKVYGPVGAGTVTVQAGATFGAGTVYTPYDSYDSDITLYNLFELDHNATLGRAGEFRSLTLAGAVKALAANTTIHLGTPEGVQISGSLDGATAGTNLIFDSGGADTRNPLFLTGTVGGNLASLTADRATVVFGSPGSLANTASIKVLNQGYVGIGVQSSGSVPTAAGLMARIAPADRTAFAGTFGFDTEMDRLGQAYTFTESLDFSGFGSGLTVGSMSLAVLSGEITPPSTGYAFGNGGGGLIIQSSLADVGGSKSVTVTSDPSLRDNALAVIFRGTNTYTGNLSVTNSLAILDSPQALPVGATVTLGSHGYIGATEAFAGATTFASFLPRLAGYTASSVIGFDSAEFLADIQSGIEQPYWETRRFVTEDLDLTSLGRIYLGTATQATLLGRIVAPNQSGADRTLSLLTSGDSLTVESALRNGDVKRVEIGSDQGPHGDGTVELLGANTYAGGTTLLSGELALRDHTARKPDGSILHGPIGTGLLSVAATARDAVLRALDSWGDLTLFNPIALGTKLQLGSVDFDDFGEALGVSEILEEGYYGMGHTTLRGTISNLGANPGSLDIWSNTALHGANTFSGGVTLNFGELTIGHNSALGTGTLTINPWSYYGDSYVGLSTGSGARTIANPVVLNGSSETYLGINGRGSLTLNGAVALNGAVTLDLMNHPMFVNGAISGNGRLNVYGRTSLTLAGANTYSGPTWVESGSVVFSNLQSLQNLNNLGTDDYGYIGVGFVPANLQSDFFNRINKSNAYGAIGFDGGITITSAVNLGDPDGSGPGVAFQPGLRLGSATHAILSAAATITPQGDYYNFGGGGGLLEVNSNLVDGASPREVFVRSNQFSPLTVRLGGANTYTGGVSSGTQVYSSALIFQAGAMPATGKFEVYDGGYIGTEDASGGGAQALVDRFVTSAQFGTIGFDSFSGTYNVTGALNLGSLNGASRIYLGTTTSANIAATSITLPPGQTAYRFAGYKGGQLTVNTVLSGSNSVEIGDRSVPATFRSPTDPESQLSSVTLSGNNSYTGGTTLYTGQLLLGHANALGTGGLDVQYNYFDDSGYDSDFGNPVLGAAANLTFSNPISLNRDLTLGGSYSFTLNGVISGYAGLYKVGSNTVTLGGSNTFYGGIYIAEGGINFAHANALGYGPLGLGGPLGPTATFLVNSSVQGISGDNASDTINVSGGATLTINQSNDSQYLGQFGGTGGTIEFHGYGTTLRLGGDSSGYGGAMNVAHGITLRAAHDNAFGPANTVVTLHGGRIAVEPGVTVANNLVLMDGALAGSGTFKPSATLTIGGDPEQEHQVKLAPGFSPGTLTFDGSLLGVSHTLDLAAHGAYDWDIQNATDTSGGWDRIVVTNNGTVNISATDIAPFEFRIKSLGADGDSGLTLNFSANQAYQWTVLSAYSITGFTGSNQFAINTYDFQNSIGGAKGFNFSISGTTGNMSLMLNFDPTVVPEPSTYVLMVLGLGLVAWTIRRRRV